MKKKFPKFKNDKEFEEFVENSDLTDFLESGDLKPAKFNLKSQDTPVTIRMSSDLIKYVKALANIENIKYQKYIKLILEKHIYEKLKSFRKAS